MFWVSNVGGKPVTFLVAKKILRLLNRKANIVERGFSIEKGPSDDPDDLLGCTIYCFFERLRTMLILPLSHRVSWRNPPFVTLLIIIINAYVLFGVQGDDEEKSLEALCYYFESGLAEIEFERYRDYVAIYGHDSSQLDAEGFENVNFETLYQEGLEGVQLRDQIILLQYHARMTEDERFMRELKDNRIITHQEQIYSEWKALRVEYSNIQREVVSWNYGFIPAEQRWTTAFTYMFLHGGFGHFLGNMILLWLVGCILEAGCGRLAYLVIYLVAGLCSAGLFFLCYMASTVPLIGASGAISGAVAAYTVLFGKRKLRIFYSLGFYFNYAKVPGFIMLPIWVGNELYQFWTYGGTSNVAYVAHLGGLLSGGLLGLVIVTLLRRVNETIFDEAPQDRVSGLLEKAYALMAELEPAKARPLANEVLTIDPNNRPALLLLYTIDKLNSESHQFHDTASRLLRNLSNDGQAHNLLYDTYKEYCSIAKPPRFKPELLFTIASVFVEHDHLETAEQIVKFLVTKQPRYQQVPLALLKLGRSYLKTGMQKEGKRYLRVLCQRYPRTEEANTAVSLLKASSLTVAH